MERCNNIQKRNLLVRSLLGLAVFATFMLLDDAPTSLEESFGRISSPSSTYYKRQLRGVEDEEDRLALVKIKSTLSSMEKKKKNDTPALVSKLVTPKESISKVLCIASFPKDNEQNITAASVIHRGEYVNLALPPSNQSTKLDVECTKTDPQTGTVTRVSTDTVDSPIFKGDDDDEDGKSLLCDHKSFQPGYYDHTKQEWHDVCGRTVRDSNSNLFDILINKWNSGSCPTLSNKQGSDVTTSDTNQEGDRDDIWISVMGDSVTRSIFINNLSLTDGMLSYRTWDPREQPSPSTDMIYHMHRLAKNIKFIQASLVLSPQQTVHFTYAFKHVLSIQEPHTWEDWISIRKEGLHEDDPNFSRDRLPDVVVYSPGYHSSHLSADEFGTTLDGVLSKFELAFNGNSQDAPAPQVPVHVMLNMMPDPSKIPDRFADDRSRRTQLNEYRKNLAIIDTVSKYSVVTSVLDFFSPELPFNDKAHSDAVHLSGGGLGRRLNTINGALIIDAVCNNYQGRPNLLSPGAGLAMQ
jgi:hypothetical protein